jgi:oxygen-dependent protoporphyrinogen oxidase
MPSAIVIGGGISGLTSAYYLRKAGVQVKIVEPERAGGVVRSSSQDGFTFEHGPNVLVEKPEIRDLLTELGLASRVVFPAHANYLQQIYVGGVHNAPKSLKALFQTPLIPGGAKLSLPFKAMFSRLAKSGVEDMSVYELFSPLLGKEGVMNLLDPVLKGIYGGDLRKLSARSLFPSLWEHLAGGGTMIGYLLGKRSQQKRSIFVLRGGLESLIDSLLASQHDGAELARSVIRQRVTDISWRENFAVTLGDQTVLNADAVFVATAGSASAQFLGSLDRQLSFDLAAQRSAPLTVVHCSVPRDADVPARSFGVLFGEGQTRGILGVMYNSMLFPHMAPADYHLLTVCVGGIRDAQAADRDDKSLGFEVERTLQEKLGIAGARTIHVARWKRAIPQLEIGHYRVVESMRKLEARYSGLHFVGTDVGGVGVPDRVQAARRGVEAFCSAAGRERDLIVNG